jgi:hypothetical protein
MMYQRGQLAACQHIVADADHIGRQILAHAGVHAFIVPADENQVRLLRQFVRQRLGVEPALRLQQDNARVGGGLARFDGFEDGFGLQHQPRAAAVGLVVGLFVLAVREVAQLQGANLHQSPLSRAPDDAITNARLNHLWEQRDDIDA